MVDGPAGPCMAWCMGGGGDVADVVLGVGIIKLDTRLKNEITCSRMSKRIKASQDFFE